MPVHSLQLCLLVIIPFLLLGGASMGILFSLFHSAGVKRVGGVFKLWQKAECSVQRGRCRLYHGQTWLEGQPNL